MSEHCDVINELSLNILALFNLRDLADAFVDSERVANSDMRADDLAIAYVGKSLTKDERQLRMHRLGACFEDKS